MDLWIRSQNRQELVKAEKLYIVHSNSELCDYIRDEEGYLAKYTKEGRALEVLDEIQENMFPNSTFKGNYENSDLFLKQEMNRKLGIVYEMPKE